MTHSAADAVFMRASIYSCGSGSLAAALFVHSCARLASNLLCMKLFLTQTWLSYANERSIKAQLLINIERSRSLGVCLCVLV
jgi:hypothetical protein